MKKINLGRTVLFIDPELLDWDVMGAVLRDGPPLIRPSRPASIRYVEKMAGEGAGYLQALTDMKVEHVLVTVPEGQELAVEVGGDETTDG